MSVKVLLFVIPVLLFFSLISCDDSPTKPEDENTAPEIVTIEITKDRIPVCGCTEIKCNAQDADGDNLEYQWNTSAGSFDGLGMSVIYRAPVCELSSEISVTVTDGRGGSDEASVLIECFANDPKRILVAANHDGGGWWCPQSELTGFSASEPHQGKALADYLRNRGFQVDELPRGVALTDSLLAHYDKVIRAIHTYSSELNAFDNFLNRPTSLLLISDYKRPGGRDYLAEHLGIVFEGLARGFVDTFADHEITDNVGRFYYNAGSVVLYPEDNPDIEVLGWLADDAYVDLNDNGVHDAGEPTGSAAMGVLKHPTAKIFFIGDINGLECMPQPLIENLVTWAFGI